MSEEKDVKKICGQSNSFCDRSIQGHGSNGCSCYDCGDCYRYSRESCYDYLGGKTPRLEALDDESLLEEADGACQEDVEDVHMTLDEDLYVEIYCKVCGPVDADAPCRHLPGSDELREGVSQFFCDSVFEGADDDVEAVDEDFDFEAGLRGGTRFEVRNHVTVKKTCGGDSTFEYDARIDGVWCEVKFHDGTKTEGTWLDVGDAARAVREAVAKSLSYYECRDVAGDVMHVYKLPRKDGAFVPESLRIP